VGFFGKLFGSRTLGTRDRQSRATGKGKRGPARPSPVAPRPYQPPGASDGGLPFAIEDDDDLPLADALSDTESAIFARETIFATSSWIHEWAYDGPENSLYIRVKSGQVYRLDSVSFATVMAFYRSDSPGRFFNQHLKGRYPGDRIGSMPPQLYRNVVTTLD
jgi:hypothetical protein